MPRKKSEPKGPSRARSKGSDAQKPQRDVPSEEALQGPPPLEAVAEPSDLELRLQEEVDEYHGTSPKLTGGDLDADWQRAHMDGEEAVGGSVATPDQDIVDDLGDALGVPRGPDEEVRSSAEILDARDAKRHRLEP